MSWTHVNTTSSPDTVASGDLLLTEPSGAQNGDLLVACIAYRSNVAFAAPAGWTIANQQSSGNTNTSATGIASGLLAYQVRNGAPSLTFTRTGGGVAAGAISVYRPSRGLAELEAAVGVTLGSNGTSVSSTGITASLADELLVMLAAGVDPFSALGSYAAATDPTAASWTERLDSANASGVGVRIGIASATKTTSGATGNLSYTTGTSSRHAIITAAFKNLAGVLGNQAVFTSTPQPLGPGLGVTGELVHTAAFDPVSSGTVTLSSVPIGTAAANRRLLIVVATTVSAGTAPYVTGVSVDSVAATSALGVTQTSSFHIVKPTGTTASIDVTFNPLTLTNEKARIYVFALYNTKLPLGNTTSATGTTGNQNFSWTGALRGSFVLAVATSPTYQTTPATHSFSSFDITRSDTNTLNDNGWFWATSFAIRSMVATGAFSGSVFTSAGTGSTAGGSEFQLIGVNPLVLYGLIANNASYTSSPQAAGLVYGRRLPVDFASFSESPQNALLTKAYSIVAGFTSYVEAPQDVSLNKGTRFAADFLSFTYSPQGAEFSVRHIWDWIEESPDTDTWNGEGALSSSWTGEAPLSISWTEEL